jgi:ABC-type polysaccharide/polyol phosphate export permease
MTVEYETILPADKIQDGMHTSLTDETIAFYTVPQSALARQDLINGIKSWRIWSMLAWQDIKLRYRRSVLGPFWLTISMAITAYTMGFLYSHLFHIELAVYFPFLVAGMLGWTLISSLVIEYTDGFIHSDSYIKQIKLPYSLYIHRIATRNLIIFFHNTLVIVPVLILYHTFAKVNLHTLLIIPGLAMLYINSIIFGLILAMIGARYRDVSQIIKSLVQVVFFVTPVMWGPETLGASHQWVVNFNPFYGFLQLIREPLLGRVPTLNNLGIVLITTVIGIIICTKMFARYRARIIYWL